jgi:transketolase
LRLAREASPIVTTDKTPFEIGKAYVYRQGTDISIMSTGAMTYHALAAADKLKADGISVEVLHIPTIKPLDTVAVLASAKKTKRVITIEEAQITGGLGGAIAEFLSEEEPTHIHRMGMKDRFGESGKPEELLEHFGLTAKHIALQVHRMLIDK